MIKAVQKIDSFIEPLRKLASCVGAPLLLLAIRLWMANIFFTSGWLKFQNYLHNDWASTVFLFREVHPVPGIDPAIAAVMGTGAETILPVLLALGLLGRFAAGGLLVMTMVIQFAVPSGYGVMDKMHYLWMLLLAVPLIYGPGTLSIDWFIRRLIRRT